MRIRLHGTRDELTAMLERLQTVLVVQEVSRIYADRKPSTLCRLYLTVAIDSAPSVAEGGAPLSS